MKNHTSPHPETAGKKDSSPTERFWQAFLITNKDGKVKSSLLLNSFCLCFVFAAVYGAAFYFLIDPIHAAAVGFPVFAENLAEAILPALAGTLVCCCVWPLAGDKRVFPASFAWLALWAAACLAAMLVIMRGDGKAVAMFLKFYLLLVPAPLLMGGGAFLGLYLRHRGKLRRRTQGMEGK